MGTALSILFPVGEVGPPEEASWNVHVIAAAPPPPPPPPPPPLASSPTERTGRFSCFLLSQPYGGCAARDDLDLCPSASGMTLTRVSRGYVLRVRRQQDAYVADMHNPMANVHFIFEFGNGGVASFQQSGTTLMGPMSCGYGCMRTGPCP